MRILLGFYRRDKEAGARHIRRSCVATWTGEKRGRESEALIAELAKGIQMHLARREQRGRAALPGELDPA
jgi:hypothetical protein